MHRIISRHYRLILWISAAVTLASTMICLRLRLDLNFLSLLPSHNKQVSSFLAVSDNIGLQSLLITVVTPSDGTGDEEAEAFVDLLARRFLQNENITAVEFKRDDVDLTRFLPLLLRYLPHLLTPEDLKSLPDVISETAIRRKVAANRKLLLTPFGFAAKQLVLADPLGLADLLHNSLTLPDGSMIRKSHDGYYRSDQGHYFLFAKPLKPPEDIVFSKILMRDVETLARAAREDAVKTIAGMDSSPEVDFTGGYAIAVSDEAVTKVDIQVALAGSIIGVLLLFGLCFRTAGILINVCVPLLMSIVWTLGLAGILFGHLNLLTCIFSCVLAGLGIDFAIHLVNRFHSPEKKTKDVETRLKETFRETGGGVVVGALTTAAAFYAVAWSDFRGFRELGIVTGSGLLLCLLAMLFVLPSLLVRGRSQRNIRIAGFGLKPLFGAIAKRPWPVLSVLSIISALLIMIGMHVRFDDNLKNFRSPENKALKLQDQLTQWMGGSSAATLIVAQDASEKECAQIGATIYSAVASMKKKGLAADVIGLPAYFPSPGRQRANLDRVVSNKAAYDWERVRQTFSAALLQNGLQPQPAYETYFDTLEQAFGDRSLFLPSDLDGTPLQSVMKLFYYKENGLHHTIIYVRPTQDLWSRHQAEQFRQDIETELSQAGIANDDYIITGAHLLSAELKTVILENMRSALLLAVAAIIGLLMLYYRSVFLVIGALVPLAAALTMLSGLMVVLGIDFNFVNIIVLPMIVGIGIDDGVHLSNTFITNGYRYNHAAMARTGRGVVITTLTTMVGFGSLSFSHYPGLRSMGYVAVIGVGACLLTSLFLLPALLSIISRDRSAGGKMTE